MTMTSQHDINMPARYRIVVQSKRDNIITIHFHKTFYTIISPDELLATFLNIFKHDKTFNLDHCVICLRKENPTSSESESHLTIL